MNSLNMLLEIQENQKKINEGTKILKNSAYIHILKNLKEEFENEKVRFREKEKELDNIKLCIDELNIEENSIKSEVEKKEKVIYNEYSSNWHMIEEMQKEIECKKNTIKEINDKILGFLESKEKSLLDKENSRHKLIELKNSFLSCKETNNNKINKAKEDIKEAECNIQKLEKLIPKKLLDEFNNIRKVKGTGAAKVEEKICSECKVYVSSVVLNDILRGKTMVYCDNCGRILHCGDYEDSENQNS